MRLCCVLPGIYYLKVSNLILNEYPMIQPEYIIYDDYKETPKLLRDKQKQYDAVLFGGQSPYDYCVKVLRQEVYWNYVPRAGSTLLRALLEATLRGWDITRLSIDTYGRDMLTEVFSEFGVNERKLDFKIFEGNRADKNYIQRAFEFHRYNHLSGATSGCVTSLVKVAEALEKEGILHIMTYPTYNILREKLNKAEQMYRIKKNAESRIAVIMIKIDYPADYPLKVESEYHFMMEKNQISKQIYRYANEINASVSESDERNFLLFTSSEILEAETMSYKRLKLLSWIENVTPHTVSVGIGNGANVVMARRYALLAMLKAAGLPRNTAYALLAGGQYIGPISSRQNAHVPARGGNKITSIANNLGVSTSTIQRLSAFVSINGNNSFTSEELARGMGISRRSADRLIVKLELSGYAATEGLHMVKAKGRPARIIKLNLFS